mgnify:CR=1 FL=1
MGITHLSIELTLDLIALIIGIILIIRAKDNYPKLYWGIIATGIGIMFSWENIGWLTIVTDTPEYNFTELLNIEKMLCFSKYCSPVPYRFFIAGLSEPFQDIYFSVITYHYDNGRNQLFRFQWEYHPHTLHR